MTKEQRDLLKGMPLWTRVVDGATARRALGLKGRGKVVGRVKRREGLLVSVSSGGKRGRYFVDVMEGSEFRRVN